MIVHKQNIDNNFKIIIIVFRYYIKTVVNIAQ
jgi:hypothetical protein